MQEPAKLRQQKLKSIKAKEGIKLENYLVLKKSDSEKSSGRIMVGKLGKEGVTTAVLINGTKAI